MRTHNLCFEQKYEIYQSFSSENFQFLEVKFSNYIITKTRLFKYILPPKTMKTVKCKILVVFIFLLKT